MPALLAILCYLRQVPKKPSISRDRCSQSCLFKPTRRLPPLPGGWVVIARRNFAHLANCHGTQCGREKSQTKDFFMDQTVGQDRHREARPSKPDDSSVSHSTTLLIPLLSCCLVDAPRWVWLVVLPPINTLCFVALLSWTTVVSAIMLPQHHRAPKRRTFTLVEGFKFHTRTVGGNGTWGGFGQGANWEGDTPPVCVPRQAFIQIADAEASN